MNRFFRLCGPNAKNTYNSFYKITEEYLILFWLTEPGESFEELIMEMVSMI